MSETEFEQNLVDLLPRLWRYAYSLARNADTANDLVQQACERALSRREQFQAGTSFNAWVFTILQSIWKNRLRSEAVRRGQGTVDAEDAGLVDKNSAQDERIFLSEVFNAMQGLPEDQRAALHLVYVDGLSYDEAARILEIPAGTLTSRLVRGRAKIAEIVNSTSAEGGAG